MKKLLSIFMLVVSMTIMAIPSLANSQGSISVESTTASPGEIIEVPIYINNNPGIAALSLELIYDSKLSLISVADTGILGEYLHGNNLNMIPYKLTWNNMSDHSSNGTIVTLQFRVSTDCMDGDSLFINIEIDEEVYNINEDFLEFTSSKGTINVVSSDKGNEIHIHDMLYKPYVPATCSSMGELEHWYCSKCSRKYLDIKGENELQSVVIPYDSEKHQGSVEIVNQKQPTYNDDGYTGDTYCVSCDTLISYGKLIPALDEKIPVNEDQYQQNNIVLWDNPFTDIKKTDSYYNAIQFVYENGLFKGVSDTEFAPETTMTRAMFVTVLGRLAGVDTMYFYGSSYDDVILGEWYAPYVEWASEYGIVNGYGDGRFGVNDKITIEQAAVIMARYAEYIGLSISSDITLIHYQDSNKVSSWAVEQMKWAVENKIYSGDNYNLNPQLPAKRSLVAEIIYSFVNKFS